MPIHEYYCPNNHRIYTFLARTLADGTKVPRCPDNPGHRMERLVSQVAVLRRKESAPAPGGTGPGDDADDPRMEAAFSEMEREFAGMNEDNPDPRMLGRMMRRMAELTGQRMPGAFEEMTRRLESGEDPERLEAEYGDVLEDLDAGEGAGDAGAEAGAGGGGRLRKYLPARRDPKLYELRDFID